MPRHDAERPEVELHVTPRQHYALRLFVVGATPFSQWAIRRVTAILERELESRHTLEVIDIYQRPELAAAEQIVATPTLIRVRPPPVLRIVGDMSDGDQVLRRLGIRALDNHADVRRER